MRRLRQDDLVEVLTGKDRGRRGQIREVQAQRTRVIVQGVNIVKKHMKPRALGAPAGQLDGDHVGVDVDAADPAPLEEPAGEFVRRLDAQDHVVGGRSSDRVVER